MCCCADAGAWSPAARRAIGGAVLLSLAVFGLEINIGWYQNCIEPFVGGVMPAFNVQSIDGFLARLRTGAGAADGVDAARGLAVAQDRAQHRAVGDVILAFVGHDPRRPRAPAGARPSSATPWNSCSC